MAAAPVEACPACQELVVWAIGTQSAMWMALDAEPSPDGSMELDTSSWDGHPRARRVSPKLQFGRKQLRIPHAATCTRKDQLKTHVYNPPTRT